MTWVFSVLYKTPKAPAVRLRKTRMALRVKTLTELYTGKKGFSQVKHINDKFVKCVHKINMKFLRKTVLSHILWGSRDTKLTRIDLGCGQSGKMRLDNETTTQKNVFLRIKMQLYLP